LGMRVRRAADDRVRLDERQLALLGSLDANARLLVDGAAGTGKTLLARDAALRRGAAGERVLVLTFTEALAHWLWRAIDGPGVHVAPIRRFALELLSQVGLDLPEPPGTEEWEEVSLRAAVDALPRLGPQCDFLVVDEAQDLTEKDWLLVEEIARDRRLWAFQDPAQRFWDDRSIPDRLFPGRYRLLEAHRCDAAILALAQACDGGTFDEPAIRQAMTDQTIRIDACQAAAVTGRVAREIDRLRLAGLAAGDIAVVSL